MPEKRPRDDGAAEPPAKKFRKGFQIGPANLPDGSWRRKNQRIKAGLIEKAKVKKSYAKLREKEQPEPSKVNYDDDGEDEEDHSGDYTQEEPASLELHPDRQRLVAEPDQIAVGDETEEARNPRPRQRGKARSAPFAKEARLAQRQKEEADERARRREEALKERERKVEEREKFRRAMAKARTGGKNGQRKLGRESSVLLAKVKRMMGEA